MTVRQADIVELLEVPALPRDLAALKRLAARKRKALAKKYHPDRGGNADHMARINAVCDSIERLREAPRVAYTLTIRIRY